VIRDAVLGGASDAQHVLGFGCNLLSTRITMVEVGLWCTIHNVLDGFVKGQFPMVLKCHVPPLENPARAVLWHNNILRLEGLFPCQTPDTKVYCPLHRLRHCWMVRTLTIAEQLQLYQMPLGMDALLSMFFPNGRLPFTDFRRWKCTCTFLLVVGG
jgi:hypothetical protein